MKANVIKILSAIANLLNWAITGVNYRRRAKQCAAFKRGWCKGEYCSYCTPMSEEEADELAGRIKIETKNKNNEI